MHHQDVRRLGDQRDGNKRLQWIGKRLLGVVGDIGGQRQVREQQRVAIGQGLRHQVGAEHAGRSGAIVDDDRLAEILGQLQPDNAADDVGAAPGRERHHQTDRSGRIVGGEDSGYRYSGEESSEFGKHHCITRNSSLVSLNGFSADLRFPDHLAPALLVGADELAERLGR